MFFKENILLDKNKNAVIIDLGMAKLFDDDDDDNKMGSLCGTPFYIAPEVIIAVIKNKQYKGTRADIWSRGVVLVSYFNKYAICFNSAFKITN